jgi:hypothetical protein
LRRGEIKQWIAHYRELFNVSDLSVTIDASGQTQRHLLVSRCNKIRLQLAQADDAAENPDSSSALDGAGVCISLVAQDILSTAELLDRNGVAPIKPDRDNDEDLVRRIPAHKQKMYRMWRHAIRVARISGAREGARIAPAGATSRSAIDIRIRSADRRLTGARSCGLFRWHIARPVRRRTFAWLLEWFGRLVDNRPVFR